MIQPAFSIPQDFEVSLKPQTTLEQEWFIFLNDEIIVHKESGNLPSNLPFEAMGELFLGTYNEKNLFAISITETDGLSEWSLKNIRELFGVFDDKKLGIAGYALQLINWDRTTQFCGCCGHKTLHKEHERAKECPSCGALFYPKLTPVIMALVHKDDKILLARSPHFPPKMYSALAGFVDPGETLEECLKREVYEEVGIKVKNITYFGSQSWPLSRSLMVAFKCDWAEGEIVKDPLEIEDAGWFDQTSLPQLPAPYSIARLLIDSAYDPS